MYLPAKFRFDFKLPLLMKIALLGYGKMGQVIEKIALQRGHEIVVRKSIEDSFDGLEKATVAIDF
jgi:4-hydroxy-tetrahydrodipicolinate reductase